MKNGSLLDTFAEEIRHLGFHTYRAAEWYRGELFVHELLPASACLNSYSIAKVFTVTAAGLLYDRGLMSVEEKVAEIFRREFPEAHDPKWERMTVDHVLSHRAGFPSGFLDIDVQDRSEYGTDDFLQYLFRTRLACEPGEPNGFTATRRFTFSPGSLRRKRAGCWMSSCGARFSPR